MTSVLLLGLGNVLYGDEGVGVHLVRHLQAAYSFDRRIDLIDGGVLGWALGDVVLGYDPVFVLDAVVGKPGEVYRFTPENVPAGVGFGKLSSHEWEILEIIWALGMEQKMPEIVFYTIGVVPSEIESQELRVGLKPESVRAAKKLVRALLKELVARGYSFKPAGSAPIEWPIEAFLEQGCTKRV